MLVRIVCRILLWIGLALLCVNIAGFFIPLRDSDIYREEHVSFKDDITLNENQLWAAAVRRQGESAGEYVHRLNKAVNEGIVHYWEDEGIYKYNLRVPIQENYLLFLASYLLPQQYAKYEYCDYRKAIKRGVGLCSQQAIIVAGLLEGQGINSRVVALSGHVVAAAQVGDDTWWIVDPDFGVVIPHSLPEVENDPGIVKPFYKQKGYSDEVVENLAAIYGKENNSVYGGVREYRLWKIYEIERLSYIFIWVIPIILVIPYLLIRRNDWLH